MEAQLVKDIADFLHKAEKQRKEVYRITADWVPHLTIEDGYRIQEEIVRQKVAEGHRIIGPKMGITSEAKMKQMNVDNPIYGYIFDYMILEDNGQIPLDSFIHPKVEPEIGVILKKDLSGPNVTIQQVLKHVDYVFPAIEIIDSRYENFNFTLPDVIADNTSAAGVIFGSYLGKVEKLALDLVGVSLYINEKPKAFGTAAAVLGHPLHSIARLANLLYEKNEVVKAGQPILTGGITEAISISPGDHIRVTFNGLGDVSFFAENNLGGQRQCRLSKSL